MEIVAANADIACATSAAAASRWNGSDKDWRAEMKQAVRDPAQLLAALDLPLDLLPAARAAAEDFPLFAPWGSHVPRSEAAMRRATR